MILYEIDGLKLAVNVLRAKATQNNCGFKALTILMSTKVYFTVMLACS